MTQLPSIPCYEGVLTHPHSYALHDDESTIGDESDGYVLADNYNGPCHLNSYFTSNTSVPFPQFTHPFDCPVLKQSTRCDPNITVSWADDDDRESHSLEDDSFSTDASLKCQADDDCSIDNSSVSSRLNVPIGRSENSSNIHNTNDEKGDTKLNSNKSSCSKRTVQFPPPGQEVLETFDCPWTELDEDYFDLHYTARELQQMQDESELTKL
jgi:hypothetical protein